MSEQNRDDLQRRFDAQAEDLGLSRGEDAPAWADDRTVGKAFATSAIVDVPLGDSGSVSLPPNASLNARAAQVKDDIEAVLQQFESTSHDDFPGVWDQIALQPFVVVGEGWMSVVTETDYAAHESEGDTSTASGGTVQLVGPPRLLSPHRAVAVYEVNGTRGMAVLFEQAEGWRIAIIAHKS